MQPLGDNAVSIDLRLAGLAAFLSRYRYAAAAADQLAISLFNFVLTFALVRVLSPAEFGIVTVWMAVATLAIGIHTALISMPLSIHVPGASDEAYRRRLEGALAAANLAVIGLAVASVICVTSLSEAEWTPPGLVAGIAIPLFVGTGLYREYYRSIAFGRNDMVLLALVDGPYLLATTLCLAAILAWPQSLANVATAFLAMSIGGAAAQLCGSGRSLRYRSAAPLRERVAVYRGILPEAMWSLAGVVFTHIQMRSYIYITTSLLGLAQVAALNAVGVLFRPVQTLLTAWRRAALPQMTTMLTARRIDAFDRTLMMALAAAAAGVAAWCGALWLAWRAIEHYLLAGKYADAGLLLLPWAVAIGFETIDFVLSTGLQAAREFRFLALIVLVTAPITALATVGFTLWRGYAWTVFGIAIGDALAAAIVGVRLQVVRRRLIAAPAPADMAAPPAGRPAELDSGAFE